MLISTYKCFNMEVLTKKCFKTGICESTLPRG